MPQGVKRPVGVEVVKTTLYLPKSTHTALRVLAAQKGVAMTDLVIVAIVKEYGLSGGEQPVS